MLKVTLEMSAAGVQKLLDKTAHINPDQDMITFVEILMNGERKMVSKEQLDYLKANSPNTFQVSFDPITLSRSQMRQAIKDSF